MSRISDKEMIFILLSPFILAFIIISTLIYCSDIKRLDACEKVCYPNTQVGYSVEMKKCVCSMRVEYRELK